MLKDQAQKDDAIQPTQTSPSTDPASSTISSNQPITDQSATPVSSNELETLKKQLADAKKQIESLTTSAKRALADLENYRRRSEDEKAAFVTFANAKLILELLPVADNFKRAFAQIPPELEQNDWVKGVTQIEKQLIDFLEKQEIKEINALNQPFNPHVHEALLQGPGPKDTVIEVFEKGYLLGDRVLRPTKVKVGHGENPSPSPLSP